MKFNSIYILLLLLTLGSCREDEIIESTTTDTEVTDISGYNYYLRTIEEEKTTAVFSECKARMTPDETLITAYDSITDSVVIVGIIGFNEGEFYGNIFGLDASAEKGISRNSIIKIEEYGAIGEKIKGSFIDEFVKGDFVAERIQ